MHQLSHLILILLPTILALPNVNLDPKLSLNEPTPSTLNENPVLLMPTPILDESQSNGISTSSINKSNMIKVNNEMQKLVDSNEQVDESVLKAMSEEEEQEEQEEQEDKSELKAAAEDEESEVNQQESIELDNSMELKAASDETEEYDKENSYNNEARYEIRTKRYGAGYSLRRRRMNSGSYKFNNYRPKYKRGYSTYLRTRSYGKSDRYDNKKYPRSYTYLSKSDSYQPNRYLRRRRYEYRGDNNAYKRYRRNSPHEGHSKHHHRRNFNIRRRHDYDIKEYYEPKVNHHHHHHHHHRYHSKYHHHPSNYYYDIE
ncbi:hypothetical protein K502DRAFT_332676 [Neoconidiobolus thromboides FSU 785]|nr:hypothetical protein K502DRAFT_332676 [Neoconidiobolus thromboides FSU 785]